MTGILPFGAGLGFGAVSGEGLGAGACPKIVWEKTSSEKTNEQINERKTLRLNEASISIFILLI
jgi:hypothetical protein